MRILWRIYQEPKEVITSKEIAEKEEISIGVTLKMVNVMVILEGLDIGVNLNEESRNMK